jgi:hypothetical protein
MPSTISRAGPRPHDLRAHVIDDERIRSIFLQGDPEKQSGMGALTSR